MDKNQYYGPAANFMPNANPYYHPSMMSPRAAGPLLPQTNQVPHFNPCVMKQPMPIPQYSQNQFHYSNNQSRHYSSVSPGIPSSIPFQSSQPNPTPNQANFQYVQPSSMPFYQNQTVPSPNYYSFPIANQYADTMNVKGVHNTGQLFRKTYTDNPGNYYPSQGDSQQLSYIPTPPTSNSQTSQAGELSGINNGPQQSKEPTQTFKPTYVIGDYKCSDFPNLYTGPFRYSGHPTQRKPFTLKGDCARHSSQPNPDRRTQIGLTRHAKRWELRGGKYYGCFTSRTNGLQDICPKAECKLCPIDRTK